MLWGIEIIIVLFGVFVIGILYFIDVMKLVIVLIVGEYDGEGVLIR